MRVQLYNSVWFLFLLFCVGFIHAQTDGVSSSYQFSIHKKVLPPTLEILTESIRLEDQNGNLAIDANEACALVFQVTNTGVGDGLNLQARLKASGSTSGISFPANTLIANCNKGTQQTYRVPFSTNMATQDGKVQVILDIQEPNAFDSDPITVNFDTRAFVAPSLKVVDFALNNMDGSGSLALKKPFTLEVLIQNVGRGAASQAALNIKVPENTAVMDGELQASLGQKGMLAPGEVVKHTIQLILNAKFVGTDVPIQVDLSESYGKYAEDWVEHFTLNQQVGGGSVVIDPVPNTGGQEVQEASLRSDVDKNIPSGLKSNAHRYAVVIGNEDYHSQSPSLDPQVDVLYAVNDAVVFAQYAEQVLGYPKRNIFILTNATKAKMSQEMTRLENMIDAEKGQAEVLFYYSGHGLPDAATKDPYLIPVDVDGSIPSEGIALKSVYDRLSKFPSKRLTFVLDACFSGGARQAELVANKGIRVATSVEDIPANAILLASSSGAETSGVYKEKQHGYFTYFLLKEWQAGRFNQPVKSVMLDVESAVRLQVARDGGVQTPQVVLGGEVDSQVGF